MQTIYVRLSWTIVSGKKKSTKIKFLGPETARWGGGLPREGVVAENFVPALETLSSLGFEERNPGCPGNFAGMSRTPGAVQKVRAKKLRAHFSFPNCTWIWCGCGLPFEFLPEPASDCDCGPGATKYTYLLEWASGERRPKMHKPLQQKIVQVWVFLPGEGALNTFFRLVVCVAMGR